MEEGKVKLLCLLFSIDFNTKIKIIHAMMHMMKEIRNKMIIMLDSTIPMQMLMRMSM